jgi:hypothetical protein
VLTRRRSTSELAGDDRLCALLIPPLPPPPSLLTASLAHAFEALPLRLLVLCSAAANGEGAVAIVDDLEEASLEMEGEDTGEEEASEEEEKKLFFLSSRV